MYCVFHVWFVKTSTTVEVSVESVDIVTISSAIVLFASFQFIACGNFRGLLVFSKVTRFPVCQVTALQGVLLFCFWAYRLLLILSDNFPDPFLLFTISVAEDDH